MKTNFNLLTVSTPANQADSMADHHGAPAPAEDAYLKKNGVAVLDIVVDRDGVIRKIT